MALVNIYEGGVMQATLSEADAAAYIRAHPESKAFSQVNFVQQPQAIPQDVTSQYSQPAPTTPAGYTEAKMAYGRGEISQAEFYKQTGITPPLQQPHTQPAPPPPPPLSINPFSDAALPAGQRQPPPDIIPPTFSNITGAQRTIGSMDAMILAESNEMAKRESAVIGARGNVDVARNVLRSYDVFIQDGQFTGNEEWYSRYQKAYTDYEQAYKNYNISSEAYEKQLNIYEPIIARRNEIAGGLGIAISEYNANVERENFIAQANYNKSIFEASVVEKFNVNPTRQQAELLAPMVSPETGADMLRVGQQNTISQQRQQGSIAWYNINPTPETAGLLFESGVITRELYDQMKANIGERTRLDTAVSMFNASPTTATAAGLLASGQVERDTYDQMKSIALTYESNQAKIDALPQKPTSKADIAKAAGLYFEGIVSREGYQQYAGVGMANILAGKIARGEPVSQTELSQVDTTLAFGRVGFNPAGFDFYYDTNENQIFEPSEQLRNANVSMGRDVISIDSPAYGYNPYLRGGISAEYWGTRDNTPLFKIGITEPLTGGAAQQKLSAVAAWQAERYGNAITGQYTVDGTPVSYRDYQSALRANMPTYSTGQPTNAPMLEPGQYGYHAKPGNAAGLGRIEDFPRSSFEMPIDINPATGQRYTAPQSGFMQTEQAREGQARMDAWYSSLSPTDKIAANFVTVSRNLLSGTADALGLTDREYNAFQSVEATMGNQTVRIEPVVQPVSRGFADFPALRYQTAQQIEGMNFTDRMLSDESVMLAGTVGGFVAGLGVISAIPKIGTTAAGIIGYGAVGVGVGVTAIDVAVGNYREAFITGAPFALMAPAAARAGSGLVGRVNVPRFDIGVFKSLTTKPTQVNARPMPDLPLGVPDTITEQPLFFQHPDIQGIQTFVRPGVRTVNLETDIVGMNKYDPTAISGSDAGQPMFWQSIRPRGTQVVGREPVRTVNLETDIIGMSKYDPTAIPDTVTEQPAFWQNMRLKGSQEVTPEPRTVNLETDIIGMSKYDPTAIPDTVTEQPNFWQTARLRGSRTVTPEKSINLEADLRGMSKYDPTALPNTEQNQFFWQRPGLRGEQTTVRDPIRTVDIGTIKGMSKYDPTAIPDTITEQPSFWQSPDIRGSQTVRPEPRTVNLETDITGFKPRQKTTTVKPRTQPEEITGVVIEDTPISNRGLANKINYDTWVKEQADWQESLQNRDVFPYGRKSDIVLPSEIKVPESRAESLKAPESVRTVNLETELVSIPKDFAPSGERVFVQRDYGKRNIEREKVLDKEAGQGFTTANMGTILILEKPLKSVPKLETILKKEAIPTVDLRTDLKPFTRDLSVGFTSGLVDGLRGGVAVATPSNRNFGSEQLTGMLPDKNFVSETMTGMNVNQIIQNTKKITLVGDIGTVGTFFANNFADTPAMGFVGLTISDMPAQTKKPTITPAYQMMEPLQPKQKQIAILQPAKPISIQKQELRFGNIAGLQPAQFAAMGQASSTIQSPTQIQSPFQAQIPGQTAVQISVQSQAEALKQISKAFSAQSLVPRTVLLPKTPPEQKKRKAKSKKKTPFFRSERISPIIEPFAKVDFALGWTQPKKAKKK